MTTTNTTNGNDNGKAKAKPASGVNHRAYYATVWPNWQTKLLGPQPTNEQLAVIHGLKARPGKQALANAMALRDGGVTGSQIKSAVALIDGGSNPQLNKMRSLVTAGLLAWVPMPVTGGGKVYRTKLTPLGASMVKGNATATVHVTTGLKAVAPKAPAKPKAKRKPAIKAPGTGEPAAEYPIRQAKPATPAQPATRTVLTNEGPKQMPAAPQQPTKA